MRALRVVLLEKSAQVGLSPGHSLEFVVCFLVALHPFQRRKLRLGENPAVFRKSVPGPMLAPRRMISRTFPSCLAPCRPLCVLSGWLGRSSPCAPAEVGTWRQ